MTLIYRSRPVGYWVGLYSMSKALDYRSSCTECTVRACIRCILAVGEDVASVSACDNYLSLSSWDCSRHSSR